MQKYLLQIVEVEVAAVAAQIAAGNVSVAVPLKAGDRASLMFSLGTMRDQLATMVRTALAQ